MRTTDASRLQDEPSAARLDFGRLREFAIGAAGRRRAGERRVRLRGRQAPAAHETAPTARTRIRTAKPRRRIRSGAGSAQPAEKYDFYEMLPNFEVVVPEKDKEVKRDLPTRTAKIERPGVYVLQAGSYRNRADADRVAHAARAAGHRRQGAARRRRRRRLAPRPHRADHQARRAQQAAQAAAGRRLRCTGGADRRLMAARPAQSSLILRKSTPSERSLRYRWVRSMPTRLASWPTLPLHSSSCCCR